MSDYLKIQFIILCGLRGYHELHSIWIPTLHKVLKAKQESGRRYDCFGITCNKTLSSMSHWVCCRESPKRSVKTYSVLTTLFYFARNSQQWLWTLTMEGRLAVVQGGLEMSIQVTVEMDLSEKNWQCLDKYETLVGEKCKEPVDDKFEDATDSQLVCYQSFQVWTSAEHWSVLCLPCSSPMSHLPTRNEDKQLYKLNFKPRPRNGRKTGRKKNNCTSLILNRDQGKLGTAYDSVIWLHIEWPQRKV